MNSYDEMLAGYADPNASYPDADPDSTTGCADIDADLCIRSMSLCCNNGMIMFFVYVCEIYKSSNNKYDFA